MVARLSPEQEKQIRDLAVEKGDDPDEVVAEVAAALEDEDSAEKPAPGKTDEAAGGAPVSAESGAKAHGGRGYFSYEYPFLKVNEVRASLFLDAIADGELFTGEWLAKHSGSAAAAPAADNQENSDG